MEEQKDYFTLEDVIRNAFMSVVWSHKIHEQESDRLAEKYKILEFLRVTCDTMTTVGVTTIIFADESYVKIVSAVISAISTIIGLMFRSFDIPNKIYEHKQTANLLLVVRDKLKLLLLDIKMNTKSANEIRNAYEMLLGELHKIYQDAPNTENQAVKRANKAINIRKDNEFSDREIDNNLPQSLRKEV